MIWQPLNLSTACPPHANVSSCSHFAFVYLNLLVQLFGDSIDRRINEAARRTQFEEYDAEEDCAYKDYEDEEYDFIVVGAGAAGCVAANRLSANRNWRVLLLEAGPEQPDITMVPGLTSALRGSNVDWSYKTTNNGKSCLAPGHTGCNMPRGKMMGGSSSINSMVYVRGHKYDYDSWASAGNDGWNYKDVLPYFKKSERNVNKERFDTVYHGSKGEQYVSRFPYVDEPSKMLVEAFNQRGLPILDFNAARQEGVDQSQACSVNGERVSANNAFIQPIRWRRRNLVVKTEAEAIKILFDKEKRAYGIVYVQNGKRHTATARKEVILSGGVINTPKLLMLSGIGPRRHLKECGIPVVQDLAVGENFHDHVTFTGIVIALSNRTATTVSNREILESITEYAGMQIKEGPLSALGPIASLVFMRSEPDLPAPDIQVQTINLQWEEFVNDPITAGKVSVLPYTYYNGLLPKIILLDPKSKGVILLNETNPNGPPILYPNYFGEESDLLPIVKGVRYVLSLEDTPAFKSRGAYFVKTPLPACKQHEWGTDEYIICLAKQYTVVTHHQAGTCKMGPKSDPKAVVDPTLKVYGVKHLRVIDASIMPMTPRGNTVGPSIMLGERGVAFVLDYWRHKQV